MSSGKLSAGRYNFVLKRHISDQEEYAESQHGVIFNGFNEGSTGLGNANIFQWEIELKPKGGKYRPEARGKIPLVGLVRRGRRATSAPSGFT